MQKKISTKLMGNYALKNSNAIRINFTKVLHFIAELANYNRILYRKIVSYLAATQIKN